MKTNKFYRTIFMKFNSVLKTGFKLQKKLHHMQQNLVMWKKFNSYLVAAATRQSYPR